MRAKTLVLNDMINEQRRSEHSAVVAQYATATFPLTDTVSSFLVSKSTSFSFDFSKMILS